MSKPLLNETIGENIQVIVMILIGIGYGVAAILKKSNEYLNRKRMEVNRPRPVQEKRAQDVRSPHRKPDFVPTVQSTDRSTRPVLPGPEPKPDMRAALLRELEKALTGVALEDVEAGETPSQARLTPVAPAVSASIAPASREVYRANFQPSFLPAYKSSFQPTAASTERVAAHDRQRRFTRVRNASMGHLAVIRRPEDLRRGFLMAEILAPPRALRPFQSTVSARSR
jgi:hypothetical protein